MSKSQRSIIVFPMVSREGQIRDTVDALLRQNGPAADRYWKDAIARLRQQLQASGLSDEVVHEELRTFAKTVLARIHDLHHTTVSAQAP